MNTIEKLGDSILFFDEHNNAFPSIVQADNGDVLLIFRQTPVFDDGKHRHTHAKAKVMLSVSHDGGQTFSRDARHIFGGGELGGASDPCIKKLSDGTLIITVFFWRVEKLDKAVEVLKALGRPESDARLLENDDYSFLSGSYVYRSEDNGKTWDGPFCISTGTIGIRGATVELPDGRLLAPCSGTCSEGNPHAVRIFSSADKGKTWEPYSVSMENLGYYANEPALYLDKKGVLHMFFRTEPGNGGLHISHSHDLGKTWSEPEIPGLPVRMPYCPLELQSGNVLLFYGKRNYDVTPERPRGIYALLMDENCGGITPEREICLRGDASRWDSSYAWACQLSDGDILGVYYYHDDRLGNIRYIAGTRMREVEVSGK